MKGKRVTLKQIGWYADGIMRPLMTGESLEEIEERGWEALYVIVSTSIPDEARADAGDGYTVPKCPQWKIVGLYHKHLKGILPEVMLDSKIRKSFVGARWKEVCMQGRFDEEAGLRFFDNFFAAVAQSRFLTGRTASKDRKPFKADLMWLMRPTNFVKVCEGKYKD